MWWYFGDSMKAPLDPCHTFPHVSYQPVVKKSTPPSSCILQSNIPPITQPQTEEKHIRCFCSFPGLDPMTSPLLFTHPALHNALLWYYSWEDQQKPSRYDFRLNPWQQTPGENVRKKEQIYISGQILQFHMVTNYQLCILCW